MAKIRQYGPRVNPVDASVGRVNANPEAFGEREARASAQIGQAVSNVGKAMYQIQERQEVLAAEKEMSRLQNSLDQQLKQSMSGGPQPENFAERFVKGTREQLDKLEQNFSTIAGRTAYQRKRNEIYNSFEEKAVLAQTQMAGERAFSDYSEILSNRSSYIVSNPGEFKSELERVETSIASVEETGAFKGADMREEKANARATMAESAVRGWMDRDPEIAYQKVKSGEYDQYFKDGKQKARLMKLAKSRADSAANFRNGMSEAARTQYRTDPYKFARRAEINSPAPEIDWNDPQSILRRQQWINEFKETNFGSGLQGIEPPLIDKTEKALILQGLKNDNPDVVIEDLRKYKEAMPKNLYNKFSKEIFKDSPEYGVALAVADTDEESARQIILGAQAKEKKNFKFESGISNDIKNNYNDYMGDALGNNPNELEFKDKHYQAVESLLAYKVSSGEIDMNISENDVKEAFKQVLGPVFKVNSKKVLTFKSQDGGWVDQDYFTEIVEEASMEDIISTSGKPMMGSQPLPKNLFREAEFVPRASGQYHLKLNGRIIMGENNKPFILNMKALEETGKFERPGFFGSML